MTGGQAEPNPSTLLSDPTADLDQPPPHRFQRRACHTRLLQPPTQRIEQPIGGGMQHQPKLVSPEAVATEPIGKTARFEILDPVLALPTVNVPVVDLLWRTGARRHHEPGVSSL